MRTILCLFLCCVTSFASADSGHFSGNPKGPYSVGLRVVAQYDFSRSFKAKSDRWTGQPVQGETARPVQTLVWYPAKPGGQQLRYLDYVRSRITEDRFDLTDEKIGEQLANVVTGLRNRLGAKSAAEVLDSRMWASRDAQPVAGKFPVLVYAPGGGGAADENADMFEYLASHGYVVIASTSMGPATKQMAYEMADAEAQVRDIQFLIGFAQSLPQSDMRRLAVAGWSWGGMNNVIAAARDSRIAALISLDGTREPAITKLIPPQRITVPWLYVARTPDTVPTINRKQIDTSFSLLNEAKYADVYQLTMYPMTHFDVVSSQLRQAPDSEYTEYSREEVARAYGWLVRYVHHFLNAQLKNDAQGLAFINNTPRKNGVPAHMMLAETSRAVPLPPSREGLAAELAKRGFGQAHAAYQEAQKRDVKFTLSEGELKSWGYGLLGRDSVTEAVEIFKLWTILYPDSWDAFDSLAEAYEQRKDIGLAIKHYQRSVQLNPDNGNGVRRLAALALVR